MPEDVQHLTAQSPASGACVSVFLCMNRSVLRGSAPALSGTQHRPAPCSRTRSCTLFLHSASSLIPADKHCEWKTAKNSIQWETKAFWKLAFAKRETATLALTLTLTLTLSSALSFYSVIWMHKGPNVFFELLWARL